MRPAWLQELRDLLGYADYATRWRAMVEWERRWLLELHAGRDLSELERRQGRVDVLEMAEAWVRRDLGQAIAQEVVTTSVRQRDEWHRGGGEVTEVRGEAMVMRREPQSDG